MSRPLILAALGLALTAAPSLAQETTPAATTPAAAAAASPAAGAKLSEILAKIEVEPGFLRFKDIEWDSSDSQWEIEYSGAGGRRVQVVIDAMTGEPVVQ